MAENLKDWDGQLMAVVTPESYPNHLRGVFLTRSAEVASQHAKRVGGMVFRPIDLDELAKRSKQ